MGAVRRFQGRGRIIGVLAGVALLVVPSASASARPTILSAQFDASTGDLTVRWSKPDGDLSNAIAYSDTPETRPIGETGVEPGCTSEDFHFTSPNRGYSDVSSPQATTHTFYLPRSARTSDGATYIRVSTLADGAAHGWPRYRYCTHTSSVFRADLAASGPPPPPPGGSPPPPSGEPIDFGRIGEIRTAKVGHRYKYGFCKVAISGVPVGTQGLPKGRLCMDSQSRPRFDVIDPTGGTQPYSFRLKIGGGHPPRGLVLNTNTGWLAGVPARGTDRVGRPPGTHKFIVCAYSRDDLHNERACRRVTLKVCPRASRISWGGCVPKRSRRMASAAGPTSPYSLAPWAPTYLTRAFEGLL